MKSLIRLCFRRPVGVTAVTILFVALSAVAYVRLPVALLPDLGYPALKVCHDGGVGAGDLLALSSYSRGGSVLIGRRRLRGR